jgi:RimJ/RimL family protein N-acetyltransferase
MLTTNRLTLRLFRSSDLPAYAEMNANAEVMRYLGGPIGRAVSDAQARYAEHSWKTLAFAKMAIERTSDGAFLGMCGLSIERWYPNDLELGWRLAPQFWGNGYATEAAAAWLIYAFNALGADRVISITDVPNVRSIAIMRRLGMVFDHQTELDDEGEPFEAVIYSIGREQLALGG